VYGKRRNVMHAEFTLYFGMCDDHSGYGEGHFDSKGNEYSIRRYNAALVVVQQRMKGASEGWKHAIKFGYEHFVENDQEATALIEHAQKNIRGAYGVIELTDACHGMIRFFRKIRFEGVGSDQKESLIVKLKESGFAPTVKVYDHPMGDDEAKRDRKWAEALKFFE
jgi:hypothetical protein